MIRFQALEEQDRPSSSIGVRCWPRPKATTLINPTITVHFTSSPVRDRVTAKEAVRRENSLFFGENEDLLAENTRTNRRPRDRARQDQEVLAVRVCHHHHQFPGRRGEGGRGGASILKQRYQKDRNSWVCHLGSSWLGILERESPKTVDILNRSTHPVLPC